MNTNQLLRRGKVARFVPLVLGITLAAYGISLFGSGLTRQVVSSFPVGPATVVALVVIAFFAGVGITTIGPGGIFLTIALYSFTPLSPGTIAGTAQTAFVVTGLVGTVMYVKSGELRTSSLSVTAVLSVASVVGAVCGALVNAHVSRALFGLLLGALAGLTGLVILYRERRGFMPLRAFDADTTGGRLRFAGLGFVLGGFSGLLGVGGPVLAVPALVLVGVGMLPAIAVAQVQSIFIAVFASLGYVAQGTVSLPLAILVGLPLTVGVVAGWRVAHLVDPNRLKVTLGGVLLLVGPYLAF